MMKSHTLTDNAAIKQLQQEILFNTNQQHLKKSNTLVCIPNLKQLQNPTLPILLNIKEQ